jgi:hypothetical protein
MTSLASSNLRLQRFYQTAAVSGAGFVDNYRLGEVVDPLGLFLVRRGTFCVKIRVEARMGQAWIITSRAWGCTSVNLWPWLRTSTFFFSPPPMLISALADNFVGFPRAWGIRMCWLPLCQVVLCGTAWIESRGHPVLPFQPEPQFKFAKIRRAAS